MKKVKRICEICKSEFTIYPCRLKNGRGRTCSRKCHFEYQKIRPYATGKYHHGWKGGKPIRIGHKKGENSSSWLGEKAGYSAKHLWLQKEYGKANKCENPLCQSKNPKRFHWANIKNHQYTRNRQDYKMLCVSCHVKMDRKNLCHKGHELNEKNTYYKKNGERMCRICGLERQRNWHKNNREYYNLRHKEYMKKRRTLKICHL